MMEMIDQVDRSYQDFPNAGATYDGNGTGGGPTGGTTTGGTTTGGMSAGVESTGGEPLGGERFGGEMAGGMPRGGEDLGGMDLGGESTGGMTSSCDPAQTAACIQCDENGEFFMPMVDAQCPTIECPEADRSLDQDGNCVETVYNAPPLPSCEMLGRCQSIDDQSCEVSSSEVIATGGACQEVTTCESGVDPEVSQRPNGALCYTWGECQDGECSASSSCATFVPYNRDNRYCSATEDDQGVTVCAFLVFGTGLNADGRTTCTEFCERSGGACVDGWNNANNNNCQRGSGNDGCDVSYESQVCLCSAP